MWSIYKFITYVYEEDRKHNFSEKLLCIFFGDVEIILSKFNYIRYTVNIYIYTHSNIVIISPVEETPTLW